MGFYVVSDTVLTSIADAIRVRSGENKELIFPTDFIEEIETLAQDYEIWNGNYIVTPTIAAQILETQGKVMKNNMVINEIPYTEISNTSGGNTVRIGFYGE